MKIDAKIVTNSDTVSYVTYTAMSVNEVIDKIVDRSVPRNLLFIKNATIELIHSKEGKTENV